MRQTLLALILGTFAVALLARPASALVEDSRTGPFKPNVTSPYRFGYSPKPNVLPGTRPKKKCIPHGLARCISRPRPLSPFASQVQRQSWGANHPLIKRNQPFQPEPSYEVMD
ncbi:MAG TPA: hypothetical protein VJR29_01980 [bacterium]|nr:hypothetical protein [bacterium]